jgi:hypothetical protein
VPAGDHRRSSRGADWEPAALLGLRDGAGLRAQPHVDRPELLGVEVARDRRRRVLDTRHAERVLVGEALRAQEVESTPPWTAGVGPGPSRTRWSPPSRVTTSRRGGTGRGLAVITSRSSPLSTLVALLNVDSGAMARARSQGGCRSQANLLHVLEGNSPLCRAAPQPHLERAHLHHGAAGVFASTRPDFRRLTGGAKIHGDFGVDRRRVFGVRDESCSDPPFPGEPGRGFLKGIPKYSGNTTDRARRSLVEGEPGCWAPRWRRPFVVAVHRRRPP